MKFQLFERQSTGRSIIRTIKNGFIYCNKPLILFRECISQVLILSNCDEENINEWLIMDIIDLGYNILSNNMNYSLVGKGDTEGKKN